MSISEPFIKRPVMTTLVMSGILLFGIVYLNTKWSFHDPFSYLDRT